VLRADRSRIRERGQATAGRMAEAARFFRLKAETTEERPNLGRRTSDLGPRTSDVGRRSSDVGSATLIQRGYLPEHLPAERKDEREPVVPLHPADRDADQLAVGVQHAAARDARMAVGQARHEIVGGALADIAARED